MQQHGAEQERRVGEVKQAAHALSEAVRCGDAEAVDRAIERLHAAHRREMPAPGADQG